MVINFQRNPTSLKAAEEEKGTEKYEFGVVMSAEHAAYMVTTGTESLCKNSLAGVMLPENVYVALTTTPGTCMLCSEYAVLPKYFLTVS